MPFAKPAVHAQLYAWCEMLPALFESVHCASLLHGELAHSSTSMSQVPPVGTVHNASTDAILSYKHTPLAKP
jgi:hypothetical protein